LIANYSIIKWAKKVELATIKHGYKAGGNIKINEFDVFFQEGLRDLKCKKYDLKDELQGFEYQPLVVILREFCVPAEEQLFSLEAETNDVRRGYMERSMMEEWAEEQAKIMQS
jgi:hypothetical protein